MTLVNSHPSNYPSMLKSLVLPFSSTLDFFCVTLLLTAYLIKFGGLCSSKPDIDHNLKLLHVEI